MHELKELTNQPRKCRSDKIMAKNFSGKDRIELCAKSLISLVYDLLARHTVKERPFAPTFIVSAHLLLQQLGRHGINCHRSAQLGSQSAELHSDIVVA